MTTESCRWRTGWWPGVGFTHRCTLSLDHDGEHDWRKDKVASDARCEVCGYNGPLMGNGRCPRHFLQLSGEEQAEADSAENPGGDVFERWEHSA